MAKKLISFKFDPDFILHLKKKAVNNRISLTRYIEKGMAKASNYKEKELV